MRRLRRGARRARPLSARDPLQGIGLLHDRLRQGEGCEERGGERSLVRLEEDRFEAPREEGSRRRRLLSKYQTGTCYLNCWFPTTQPGPKSPEPGAGGCGAELPSTSCTTWMFSCVLVMKPLPVADPPRRQCTTSPARNFTQPSWTKSHVDRSVEIGASSDEPSNGSEKKRPGLASFASVACMTACWFWLRLKSVHDGSRRFSRMRE